MFNNNITIFISFKNERDLTELKQILYLLFKRNKKVFNLIINLLLKEE